MKQIRPGQAACLLGFAALIFLPSAGQACARVFWNKFKGYMIVARGMDIPFRDNARLTIFPRGISRTGLSQGPGALQWTSQYGSVGVVSGGIATTDGMNEKGLSVNVQSLDGGNWGKRNPAIPGVSYRLVAQYFLDTCASVDDVLAKLDQFQVVDDEKTLGMFWPVHFAVSDASGDAAVIEYLDGKPAVHHGRQYCVMTNEPPYDEQLANLKKYKGFGGTLPLPGSLDPLARFVRLSTYLDALTKPKSREDAIAKINGVIRQAAVPRGARGDYDGSDDAYKHDTYWYTFADLSTRTYYFQSTHKLNIFWVKLAELPIAEGNPIRSIDANSVDAYGNVSALLAKQPPVKLSF